jgi:nucleoside phosphorylase
VVIAVLPLGEYGNFSSTGVAKDMLYSFPDVRIGLIVGIGGSVPSQKQDIQLGDIIVSASSSRNGSVFSMTLAKR